MATRPGLIAGAFLLERFGGLKNVAILVLSKNHQMQKTKEHTIIVRGLTKEQKDSLKRQAANKHQSVNGFILSTVKDITTMDIETFKKAKKQPQ